MCCNLPNVGIFGKNLKKQIRKITFAKQTDSFRFSETITVNYKLVTIIALRQTISGIAAL